MTAHINDVTGEASLQVFNARVFIDGFQQHHVTDADRRLERVRTPAKIRRHSHFAFVSEFTIYLFILSFWVAEQILKQYKQNFCVSFDHAAHRSKKVTMRILMPK